MRGGASHDGISLRPTREREVEAKPNSERGLTAYLCRVAVRLWIEHFKVQPTAILGFVFAIVVGYFGGRLLGILDRF
jgi:hypothetical protein